jgi:hypothetical protein
VLAFKRVCGAYQLVMERVRGIPLDCINGVGRADAVLNAESTWNLTVIGPFGAFGELG